MLLGTFHIRIAATLVAALIAAMEGSAAMAQTPVSDDDIRAAFVGHEAHPPLPWPVSFGPYEFHSDGSYFRQQDLASAAGRYLIANGRICIGLGDTDPKAEPDPKADPSKKPDPNKQCYKVLRDGSQYFLQYDDGRAQPFPVTLHPIANPANKPEK
jgi:hypothetical protein